MIGFTLDEKLFAVVLHTSALSPLLLLVHEINMKPINTIAEKIICKGFSIREKFNRVIYLMFSNVIFKTKVVLDY